MYADDKSTEPKRELLKSGLKIDNRPIGSTTYLGKQRKDLRAITPLGEVLIYPLLEPITPYQLYITTSSSIE
jgi:hypothetical protein